MNDVAKTGAQSAQEELSTLRQRLIALEGSEARVRAAAEELQHTLEELQVAEEELRQQNEELSAAHQLVEQERARYARLFELVPGGYVVTDAAGRILEANRSATSMLNVPQEELVGKPLLLFVAKADRIAFHTSLARLKPQERVQDWELQLHPRQGSPFPAGITIVVHQQPCEPEPRFYWLIQDLTAHKRAAAERQRLEREAQRAQRFALLGKLAAGVSHEIRNPLGVVTLQVGLLEEELLHPASDSREQVAQCLTDIKTHLARLNDLVQNYLSLVRVSSMSREPVDLGQVVTAWVQEMVAELAARVITLQCDGLDSLGTVALHQSTFRRALVNLLCNAMDAMPQGGILSLHGRRQATQVELEIGDSGSGIAAEDLRRIFEPLYTTKPGGTGLGLYIVQEIVAAHDGQISVQSAGQGKGTTFTITLPVTPAAPPKDA